MIEPVCSAFVFVAIKFLHSIFHRGRENIGFQQKSSIRVKENCVVNVRPLFAVVLLLVRFKMIFALKIIFAENLVEHHLDIMAGVPVAVVEKLPVFSGRAKVPRIAGACNQCKPWWIRGGLQTRASPLFRRRRLRSAVGIERRVNVNEVNAGVGQLPELFQIVAAINNAGVHKRRGIQFGGRDALRRVRADRQVSPTGGSFRAGRFLCHARRLGNDSHGVNAPAHKFFLAQGGEED